MAEASRRARPATETRSKARRLALLLAGVLPSIGTQPSATPPDVFVDRGACPGECCTYGYWRVERQVDLYKAPVDGARIVGRLEAGTAVQAQTGDVHTKPGRFVVRRAIPPYKVGDVIWVYTYLGEGYYRVWRGGAMVTQEISVMPGLATARDWGYYEKTPDSRWWVSIKTKAGLQAWTNTPERFSGTHSCG